MTIKTTPTILESGEYNITIKTKHLFKILSIVNKTNTLDEIKNLFIEANITSKTTKEDVKDKQMKLGIELLGIIVRSLGEVEFEIYDLLADLKDVEPEDISEQPVDETVNDIKKIIESEVVKDFLEKAVV